MLACLVSDAMGSEAFVLVAGCFEAMASGALRGLAFRLAWLPKASCI